MVKSFFKRLSPHFQFFAGVHELRKGNAILQAVEYERLKQELRETSPENPALSGFKVYSQTDEDGIIAAIFRKIPHQGNFVEIGVQSGTECNSLLLLLQGWKGVWLEGSAKYVSAIHQALGGTDFPGRFRARQAFVSKENIVGLIEESQAFLNCEELDLLSVDIDGNDVHVLRELLSAGRRPKVICVEYNAKFPPGISVSVRYSPDHVWDLTDYMGSSLQVMVDGLSGFGYVLLTCNIPGINAFFIREDLADAFTIYPLEKLYQPARHYLSPMQPPQVPSLGYLRDVLAS
jgi:hypothetical protein